jgi:hypothetical protein
MTPWLVIPTLGVRDHSLIPLLRDAGMPAVVVWTAPESLGMKRWRDYGEPRLVQAGGAGGTGVLPFNIHTWWNAGIDQAMQHGADIVVVVNDDVAAAPGALLELASHIEAGEPASPMLVWPHDAEHAKGRVTPMTGWCWAIDPARIRPDESFEWWYGDNDLELRARAMGAVRGGHGEPLAAHVPGIRHLRTDFSYDRDVSREIARDRRLFAARYPDLMRG